jgi:oligoendopeptidase F
MERIVSVSKAEWEAFLADYARFVHKYELTLSQLDLARTRMQGLHERTQQQILKSRETLRQVKSALDKMCEETESRLLESW